MGIMTIEYDLECAAYDFDVAVKNIISQLHASSDMKLIPSFAMFIANRSIDAQRAVGLNYNQIDAALMDLIQKHREHHGDD